MQIAIARPDQVDASWIPLGTENISPEHIRRVILYMLENEKTLFNFEYKIVTFNRTILDMVGIRDYQLIDYENVWLWDANLSMLRQLTKIKDLDWLAHFALGDLLDRNDLQTIE